jgi:pyruvate/2-oxoacid:ferredoxin oxidoreductase beta subunit
MPGLSGCNLVGPGTGKGREGIVSRRLPKIGRARKYFNDEDILPKGTRACPGCPAELSLRIALRVFGRDTIIFGGPGCMTTVMIGYGDKATSKGSYVNCLFTNIPSTMTGVSRYYRHIGKEVKLVAFCGDGALADVSFQVVSGAAERGERLTIICYDNEGYMNTGNQRSSTTSYKAWTNTTPVGEMLRGKEQKSKNMPLIMAFHGIPYTATATVAYLEDYVKKLTKAMNIKDGMSYIHLLTPCPPGWRAAMDSGIDISRLAVETNYFPLWECENGEFRLTQRVKKPEPIEEYTRLIGKFSHLTRDELGEFQKSVDTRYKQIKDLCSISHISG